MSLENYPNSSCPKCAEIYGGKWMDSHISVFRFNICDVCNEWRLVCDPKHFNNPKFTINRDLHKIFSELMEAMKWYIDIEKFDTASEIAHHIDEIIHEFLENKDNLNVPNVVLARNKGRKTRKRSSEVEGAMRKSA